MTAVMTTNPRPHLRPVGATTRPSVRSHVGVPAVARCSTKAAVRTPAIYWRRRVAAAGLAVGMLAMAGKAGAALGGSSLASPPRRPSIVTYVVHPGDSLWTVARHLTPGRDPRPVVDALAKARHTSDLQPGETIVWQR